jgi:hypothetical protein
MIRDYANVKLIMLRVGQQGRVVLQKYQTREKASISRH